MSVKLYNSKTKKNEVCAAQNWMLCRDHLAKDGWGLDTFGLKERLQEVKDLGLNDEEDECAECGEYVAKKDQSEHVCKSSLSDNGEY